MGMMEICARADLLCGSGDQGSMGIFDQWK
jgi:hypothetical protein